MKNKTIRNAAAALCAVWAVVNSAFAAGVSGGEAAEAVKGWVGLGEALGLDFSGAETNNVLTYTGVGGTGTYHVVSLNGGGFVVTSGDTAMEPILAYSKDGVWNTNAAENPLMAMLNIDVAAMMAELSSANTTNAAQATASVQQQGGGLRLAGAGTASVQQQDGKAAKWARLRAAASSKGGALRLGASAPADLRVSPLVQSSWDQTTASVKYKSSYWTSSKTVNMYNYYTPNNYYCGCVATMGAQIMRYWKWPSGTNITWTGRWYGSVKGAGGWNVEEGWQKTSGGSFTKWSPAFGGTYDWDNMPLDFSSFTATSSSAITPVQEAIGKLTRDVGLSCYMEYASGGSGAPGPVIGHRFVDQFAYANAKIINGWNNDAFLASIDAGMPCAVNVFNSDSGHAIVGDGYGYDSSGTLYVHFNMGWGSTRNISGTWYTTANIDDTGYKFTSIGGSVYNIYPPSKGAPDLTVVSGRVLSNGSAVGGVTVTAVNRETGVSYTATSSSGGIKSFNGETSSTVAKGIYALMLPAGFYTISATSGNSSAKVERQVHSCLSAAWAGANAQSVGGRVGNIHGLDLNLGTAVSAPAVSLTHRWSFTDNLNDSQGGSTATKVGSNVTIADGKAKLTGNGNGQGSLNLGTSLLDGDAATVEIWASQTAARNWARIFDYGADNTHYFCLTWSQGTDVMQDRAGSKNTAEVLTDNTMAPFRLGVQYHISATFERQSDDSTVIRFMKRDAASGRLLRSGVLTVGTGLHNISNPILYLGHSFYSSDADACAEYDEVRIWKGVLSDAQLSANAKAGPDTLLTSVPASTEYTYIETATWKGTGTPTAADLANSGNWVCTDNNGQSVTGVPGAKATVVIGGTTAFSIPSGFTPDWRKIQIGAGGSPTLWASNATLNSSLSSYMLHGANKYATQFGTGSVDTMQRGLIHNPENKPAELAGRQLRFDGWFKVEPAQAGHWKLHGYVDDYIAFKVDDEWATYGRTMGECYGSIDVAAGWHRYTMIVGDTGGGYGGCIVAGNHKKLTPVAVKINGGSELAFSSENFTFGSISETVKLGTDCDWRALGKVVLDTGASLDLGGHELKIDTATASYLGSKVTNGKLAVYGDAVDTDNLTLENVTVATEHAATPTSPTATAYVTETCTVTLECATAGATIHYTTDGSEPTAASAVYSAPFAVTGTVTVKAIAFADAYLESAVFTQAFTPAPQAAAPTATADAGYRTTLVDLASDVPGATIRYTTDGSVPTETSAIYDGSIDVTNRTGATTIKAVVFADGYRPSEVFTYDYYVKEFFGPTTGANPAAYADTPENRAAYWIFENAEYKEATGLWAKGAEYVNSRVAIEEGNEFVADRSSAARNVTIETAVTFNSVAEDHQDFDGVKAAVRIGTNSCFQVYTAVEDGTAWLDTENFTAEINHGYTVKLELDFTNKTYSASVKDGADYVPLTAGGDASFPFAHAGESSSVQSVGYVGEGFVESIFGSYTNKVFGFCVNDVVPGSDAGNSPLTADQAKWLNAFPDGRDAVANRIKALTVRQFSDAYLLNLDLMRDFGYGFSISGISAADENVTVGVTLVRTNALSAAGINGTLRLYGGETPVGITNFIDQAEFDDAKFANGDAAQAEFRLDGTNTFFKAVIE